MKECFMDAPPLTPKQARAGRSQGHGDHPLDKYLKEGRIPHIWCPGCGIGIILTAFVRALDKGGFDPDKTVVVSGIGCSARSAGYLNMDTYHSTHGRAIPFATGIKLAKPELNVVVISGDGDLFAIGGNHMIHAARRNIDLTILCINNFNYGMTGGQSAPTTPIDAKTTTTPYGASEYPFNLIYMAGAAGASYVSRWTALHTHELRDSILESMTKPGFGFIEALSPCPTAHARRNKLGTGLDLMKYYRENSYVTDELDQEKTELSLTGRIAVGTFVNREKPTFLDMYYQHVVKRATAPPQKGKPRKSGDKKRKKEHSEDGE